VHYTFDADRTTPRMHNYLPQLADVGDTRDVDAGQTDRDLPAGAEREGLIAHVGVGQHLQQLTGLGALDV
jgi:hypothetical protein